MAKDGEDRNGWAEVARYTEMGFIIPSSVIVGYLLGLLLDYLCHTHWIYIPGLIFGAILGFVQMIRRAMRMTDEK